MNRRRAIWQLLLVRAVMRRSRQDGPIEPELRERALQIVDQTAFAIEPDVNGEWAELLAATRDEVLRG